MLETYWRTNLTSCPGGDAVQSFEVRGRSHRRITSQSLLAISPARRPRRDTVSTVHGTLVPTYDRSVAASGNNHRH
jgi:hypothetical protein